MQIADIVRFVAGVVCTAALAGPTLVALWLLGDMPFGHQPYEAAAVIVSIPAGLVVATPAALVNAFVLSFLAREGGDALALSVLPGAFIGAAVHAIKPGLADFLRSAAAVHAPAPPDLETYAVFAITGAIMSIVYWLVAIRPLRRRRLMREATDSNGVDPAVQEAIERKRDRRIPWDGRVPPD